MANNSSTTRKELIALAVGDVERRCINCAYCGRHVRESLRELSSELECHRRPPEVHNGWPTTTANSFCGEFFPHEALVRAAVAERFANNAKRQKVR